MRYLLTILCIGSLQWAFAGKIEKAFERLAVKDYFWAKEYFTKAQKKEPVAASYGLSMVYGLKNSPFWQIDSAYTYIVYADTAYPDSTDKGFDDLLEYGISRDTIAHQKQMISDHFWERVTLLNTVEGYQQFIDEHDWAEQVPEAVERRNKLAFERAEDEGTWQAYQLFMDTYPDAAQYNEANANYTEFYYYDFTGDGAITSYVDYILSHPKSPFVEKAEDEVFDIATANGTVEELHGFIKRFPDNHNVERAWSMLYAKSTSNYTAESITDFLLDYPEYPYREEVMDDLTLARTQFIPIVKNDQWGYVNVQGQVMIEPSFEEVDVFSEGLAVFSQDGAYGYLNKRGEAIIPPRFMEAYAFRNGLALVETEEHYGLIDTKGRFVADTVYDDLGENVANLIYASKEGKYGFIDSNGIVVLDFVFDRALSFENGRAVVGKNGRLGVINTSGEWLIDPLFSWLEPLNEWDLCRAKSETGKFGMLNAWGDTVLDFKFDQIGDFRSGLCYGISDGNYAYYNTKGEVVFSGSWDCDMSTGGYATFVDGYAKYKHKGKFGIIDTIGERVYPAIFEAVGEYGELTPVKKRGKWGYANKDVRLVHEYIYDWAGEYHDSIAIVSYNDSFGVIDCEANFVVQPQYGSIEYFQDDVLLVELGAGKGLYSLSKGELVAPVWRSVIAINDHLIRCSSPEGMAIYDLWLNAYIYHFNPSVEENEE